MMGEGDYFRFKICAYSKRQDSTMVFIEAGEKTCSAFWRITRQAFFRQALDVLKDTCLMYMHIFFCFWEGNVHARTYVNKTLTFQSLNEHEVGKTQLFTAVLSCLNYSKTVCVRCWVDLI